LNKKLKSLARKSAFTIKAKEKAIVVLEDFSFDAPKTSAYSDMMSTLGFDGKKTLLVLGDSNKNVYLSSRNLQHTNVVVASELSTYTILNSGVVLLTEGAVEKIENILS
jgi:large subunit ribosomal protein L4